MGVATGGPRMWRNYVELLDLRKPNKIQYYLLDNCYKNHINVIKHLSTASVYILTENDTNRFAQAHILTLYADDA